MNSIISYLCEGPYHTLLTSNECATHWDKFIIQSLNLHNCVNTINFVCIHAWTSRSGCQSIQAISKVTTSAHPTVESDLNVNSKVLHIEHWIT